MKKGIYVVMAVLAVFAMIFGAVSCGSDSSPTVTQTIPKQKDGTVRFLYANGSYLDIDQTTGSTTWDEILKDPAYVAKGQDKKANNVFGYWMEKDLAADGTDVKWTDTTAVINVPQLTLKARFWSTAVSGSDALEKVWLNNTQFAIYEFDITGKDITTITHISADFKVSEAEINRGNARPIRPMGPYFYHDEPIKNTTTDGDDYYFGDFVVDANGAYAAKFNGGDTKTYMDFNKFHPYLLSNNGGWNAPKWNGLAGYDATKTPPAGDDVVPNTWFNVKLPTSGYGWNSGTNDVARVMTTIAADTTNKVHKAETVYTGKVYFGFGIANNANPDDKGKGTTATELDGITSLVKNVTIHFSDNTTKVGKIPSFPKRIRANDGTSTKDGTKTTNQVFASYIYNIQYNWRGAASAKVVVPGDPAYVPPVVVPPAPAIKTITAPADLALALMGSSADQAAHGWALSNSDLTAAVNVTVSGGGSGFAVKLPADWAGYEKIEVFYTGAVSTVTTPTQVPNPDYVDEDTTPSEPEFITENVVTNIAKLTMKQGYNSFTDYAHDGTSADSRWRDVGNGADQVYTFRVAGFNNGTAMENPGISFQLNNNTAADVPQKWSFTITKIVLTPAGM